MDKKKVALGLGLAAAGAALGAGYYFYGSKDAAGNRKKAGKWAHDVRARVIREAKKAKKLDERAFRTIVDEATKAYATARSVDKKDLQSLAHELKSNWKTIEREFGRVAAKEGAIAKAEAKRAVKAVRRVIPRRPAAKKKRA